MSEQRVRPGGERNNPLTSAEKAGMAAFAAVPELEIGGESGLQPVDDGDVLAARARCCLYTGNGARSSRCAGADAVSAKRRQDTAIIRFF
jgi:hypothetical protein